ncbi:MAG: hypothetical protein ACSHX6_11730 [Akkermansiaceae bacterium]
MIRRSLVVVALALLIALGAFAYLTHSQQKEQMENRERISFALKIEGLPDSLRIESSHVDSWTEYHLVFGCRDRSGNLEYLLEGRDWEIEDISPPRAYPAIEDDKRANYTFSREATWRGGESLVASVLFDEDGERFIIEYHDY